MKLTKDDKQMLQGLYADVWKLKDGSVDEKMVEYLVRKVSGYIRFGDYVCVIEKPGIHTNFWFPEHTYDYDEACEARNAASDSYEYFRNYNVEHCNIKLDLDMLDECDRVCMFRRYGREKNSKLVWVEEFRDWESDAERERRGFIRELTDAEIDGLRKLLEEELEKLEALDMTLFGFDGDWDVDLDDFFEDKDEDDKPTEEKEPERIKCPHCGEWIEL